MMRSRVTAFVSATIVLVGWQLLGTPAAALEAARGDVAQLSICPPDETCAAPTMDFEPYVITAGERVHVQGLARPGVIVSLFAYSRPATTFATIATSTADAAGAFVFAIAPTTNWRIEVQSVDGASASDLLLVRPRVSLGLTSSPGCHVTAGGTVFPVRAGIPVDIGYRAADGRFVRAMSTLTRPDGTYSVGRVFGSCGRTLVWQARTPPGLLNALGLSPLRSGRITR